jgi:hypothetical protein
MKKRSWLALSAIILGGSGLLLCSCVSSYTSESVSYTRALTVIYYDDAPTPAKIGYSYVVPGEKAVLPNHFYNDAAYDYVSRKGTPPTTIGDYWSFNGFSGTYADSTAIDLTNITGDCSVYAQFTEKSYHITYKYFNQGIAVRDDDGDIVKDYVAFGTSPEFPSSLVDPSPEWYLDASFQGFTVAADTNSTPSVFTGGSEFAYVSGEGDPSSAAAAGTFYADVTSTDGNPTYPIHYSTGSSWISLGTLQDALVVSLNAKYSYSFKKFSCSFYLGETTEAGTTNIVPSGSVQATVDVTYMDSIDIQINGTTTKVTYDGAETDIVTPTVPVSWAGIYLEGTNYAQETADPAKIQQTCFFYPVY